MKSALGIMLLLTAQVQAIPFTHEFTGAISDVDVVAYDTSARDQLEQTDLGRYAALSGNGLQDTLFDDQSDQLMSHGAKQKVDRVPDFGGTALLFLLSSGLLIAINHSFGVRTPIRRSEIFLY